MSLALRGGQEEALQTVACALAGPRAVRQALARIRDAVRAAHADAAPLVWRGSGSKDFYGAALGAPVAMGGLQGVVAYHPDDGVVSVRAGMPLADLEACLQAQGQCLAFEPPHFGPAATVGGMLAAGFSGPRGAYAGALCDHVLAAVVMNVQGELLRFGEPVLRPRAGYDVPRLLAGSLGVLGPIIEVSLAVVPQPRAQLTLERAMALPDALARLHQWAGTAWPISATAWSDGVLRLRLEGGPAVLAAARAHWAQHDGATAVDEPVAQAYWQGLREHTDPFFAGSEPLWRLAVPATAPPFTFLGPQLLEWGGAVRWVRSAADPGLIRQTVAALGGTATLFRAPTPRSEVFSPLAEPVLALQRRLKQAWDPHGIFNRGRWLPDF